MNVSRTHEIACHRCKVSLWIGQGNPGHEHLYTGPEAISALEEFLLAHRRHPLEVLESTELDALEDDYERRHAQD